MSCDTNIVEARLLFDFCSPCCLSGAGCIEASESSDIGVDGVVSTSERLSFVNTLAIVESADWALNAVTDMERVLAGSSGIGSFGWQFSVSRRV